MKKVLWVACAGGIGWLSGPLADLHAQAYDPAGAPAAETRPFRPRSSLQSGVELHQKGDYEQAEYQLRMAEQGQSQLSGDERGQLDKYLRQNGEALRGRRAGQVQIQQADAALKAGQYADTEALLKALRSNKFLSASDQQQVGALAEGLKAKSGRKAMDGSVKMDAEALLADARKALEKGDYDRAIQLAQEADKAGHKAVFPWSDTPAKVIAAADAAKAKGGAAPAPAGDARTAQARGLLQQAHMAVQAGDLAKAKGLVKDAEDLRVSLAYYEEFTVEKVRGEIQRAEAAGGAKVEGGVASGDPKAMVKEAKALLAKGDLDRAEDLAKRARLVPGTKWGVFDTTPDSVLEEVRKAREKGHGDRAAELLTEARKKIELNQLDEAEKLVFQAQALKSEYPIWYRGDKPEKLHKDIAAKRKLGARPVLPPLESTTVAKAGMDGNVRPTAAVASVPPAPVAPATMTPPNPLAPPPVAPPALTPPAPAAPVVAAPAVDPIKVQQHQALVAQARLSLSRGDYGQAVQLAGQAQSLGVQAAPGQDTPDDVIRAAQALQANQAREMEKQQLQAAGAQAEVNRQQALRLVAEARLYQKEGRLVEALNSAKAAQRLNAVFGPADDFPEKVVVDLQKAAQGQMETYFSAAQTLTTYARYGEAEEYLKYLEKLATGFQLDMTAVQQQLAQVQRLAATGKGDDKAVQLSGEGSQLMAQCRQALNRHDYVQARKLAEALHGGPFGMKQQADQLLREIDDLEYKEGKKRAQMAYEIGVRHYNRREFDVAAQYLQNIDLKLLDEKQRSHAQELLSSRYLSPRNLGNSDPSLPPGAAVTQAPPAEIPAPMAAPNTLVDKPAVPPLEAPPAAPVPVPVPALAAQPPANPGSPAPAANANLLEEVRTRQLIERDRLREMKLNWEKQANQLAAANKYDDAVAVLNAGIATLKGSGLDADQVGPMQKQLEQRIKSITLVRENQAQAKASQAEKTRAKDEATRRFTAEETKRTQVADYLKQYKAYMDKAQYNEAEAMAMKAREIDPQNPTVDAAIFMASQKKAVAKEYGTNDAIAKANGGTMRDLNGSKVIPVSGAKPMAFDEGFKARTDHRRGKTVLPAKQPTKEDESTSRALDAKVSVDFKNKPLKDAISELRVLGNVNIVADLQALTADGVTLDQPVDLSLDQLPLRVVLKTMLRNARLSYVVEDGIIHLTTPAGERGRIGRKIYPIADLIVPVENFAPGTDAQNATSMVNKQAMEAYGGGGLNWQVKTEPRDVSQSEYYTKGQPGKERKPGETLQNVLVKMIQDTIEPHTWDTMGGSGHIEFYPMNMSLIVSQTPDVQEQVQQLLDRLRELQNLQVTVEVRFIELDENFYERIGVDFDVDIQSASAKFQRMVTTGVFTPAGQINEPQHVREVVGLAPQGNITQDLNIPIHNSSYDLATPPFGGFPGRPGANGGLDFGIAFLSDIQVFLVMEAAQGDSRNNLLTAPKITLFNGQQASITQNQTQPYVANVIVIPGNFGGLPGIVPILGTAVSQTSLTVQAVVSADRRYVQLTLVPIISRTTIGTNPNFQPSIGGPGGTIQIQQPITTTLTVGTTVSVPDGGTILMGGLKIANEGRREFGPPILSKLPYINRLFRNVGYGREESSLLLMVTPHIIIPEEEEERLGTTFAF